MMNAVVWHRWLALIASLGLLGQVLSGVLLGVLDLAQAPPNAQTARITLTQLDALRAHVKQLHPEASVERIEILRTRDHPEPVAEVRWRGPGDALPTFTRLDLQTRAFLGEDSVTSSVGRFALYLHANWFLGNSGRYALAVLGIALISIAVTALVFWWPSVSQLRRVWNALPRVRGPARRAVLHRLGGVLALPGTIWLAVTGAALALHPMLMPVTQPMPCAVAEAGVAGDVVVEEANATGDLLRFVSFCRDPSRVVGLTYARVNGTSQVSTRQVFLDRDSGRVIEAVDLAERNAASVARHFLGWHTGRALGRSGEALTLLGGVLLFTAGAFGILTWLGRRRLRAATARR